MILERPVYPTQPAALKDTIDDLLAAAPTASIEGEILALIVPDSNLLHTGPIAAQAYKLLRGREDAYRTAVVIAPTHEGTFERLAICKVDQYRTPLGDVPVNDKIRNELCDEDDDIYLDDRGHYHTEGVDVQLPFLQRVLGDELSVVPIVMGSEEPAFCHELGMAVGEVMYGQRMLAVASADLLSAEEGALDRLIEALETFDASTLMHLLGSEQVRAEGMGPMITVVMAAKHRGANRASVLAVEPPDGEQIGALACVLWRA